MAITLGRPLRIINNQSLNINTRIAGGRITQQIKEPKIIIDIREFRSSLPSLIIITGIEILPSLIQEDCQVFTISSNVASSFLLVFVPVVPTSDLTIEKVKRLDAKQLRRRN
ncbi:hypothetical protein RhiirA4_457586 [Rhizophagus irregularis]|uniref:Uncharacterized protein n=1 Tax=Rhizophagus irregularis TaxID=588596 RepID=A0A2I1GAC1_9GLOM|nr:hypothetical protein RhiirA4_457586 [Rhizophagus irregularis]